MFSKTPSKVDKFENGRLVLQHRQRFFFFFYHVIYLSQTWPRHFFTRQKKLWGHVSVTPNFIQRVFPDYSQRRNTGEVTATCFLSGTTQSVYVGANYSFNGKCQSQRVKSAKVQHLTRFWRLHLSWKQGSVTTGLSVVSLKMPQLDHSSHTPSFMHLGPKETMWETWNQIYWCLCVLNVQELLHGYLDCLCWHGNNRLAGINEVVSLCPWRFSVIEVIVAVNFSTSPGSFIILRQLTVTADVD